MIILNKKLLITIILLTSIYIISFPKKETNFIMPKNNVIDHDYNYIDINYNDKHIKITLQNYIIGVVAAEMPASFHEEALKAQSIASRTYLINTMSTNPVDTTTNNQVYIDESAMKDKWGTDFEIYYNKISKCVKDTKREIITYNNQPIKAFYHSMSNGYTDSSINVFKEQYDYLNITESHEQNTLKTITLSKQYFCTKLDIECSNITISNIKKDKSNRIETITINNKLYNGSTVRNLLSLRSTDFTINILENLVEITTNGYGHGVGMSQYGANYMANNNKTYKEILFHYYQNTEISII